MGIVGPWRSLGLRAEQENKVESKEKKRKKEMENDRDRDNGRDVGGRQH